VTLLVGSVATFVNNGYRRDADMPSHAEIVAELTRFVYRGLQDD
jgi:hypothetical protein